MRARRVVAATWSLFAVTVVLVLAGVVLTILDPHAGGPVHPSSAGPTLHDDVLAPGATIAFAFLQALIFTVLAGAGALAAARRPRNPVGWLFGVAALCLGCLMLSDALYWHAAFGRPAPHSTAELALWVENWAWVPALVSLFSLVPLLF